MSNVRSQAPTKPKKPNKIGCLSIYQIPRWTLMIAMGTFAALTACITPSEKKDIHNDIFNVQTRLLNLERQLLDTSKDAKQNGESATKRIANTQVELDKILRDLQQIRGDLDSLKAGVVAGQLPGHAGSESPKGPTLTQLDARMEHLEKSQSELIDALKKAGLNIKTPSR